MQPPTDAEVLELLPPGSFIRNYVLGAQAWNDAPLTLHLGAALAILSVTIPESLAVEGWVEPHPAAYTLLLGPSGLRKNSVIRKAEQDLRKVDPLRLGRLPATAAGLRDELGEKPRQLLVWPSLRSLLAKLTGRGGPDFSSILIAAKQGQSCVQILQRGLRGTDHPRLSMLAAGTPFDLLEAAGQEEWSFLRHCTPFLARQRCRTIKAADVGGVRDVDIPELLAARAQLARMASLQVLGTCQGWTKEAGHLLDQYVEAFAALIVGRVPRRFHSDLIGAAKARTVRNAMVDSIFYGHGQDGRSWEIQPHSISTMGEITRRCILPGLICMADNFSADADMRLRLRFLRQLQDNAGHFVSRAAVLRELQVTTRRLQPIVETLDAEGLLEQTGEDRMLGWRLRQDADVPDILQGVRGDSRSFWNPPPLTANPRPH